MPAAGWRELGASPQRARPPGRLQARARGCCPWALKKRRRIRPIAHERRRCLAGSWSVRDGRRGRRPRREGCCIGREAHLRLSTHQVPLSRLAHADQLALQEISFSPKPRAPAPKGSHRRRKVGSRPLPHRHQRRYLDLSGCCGMRGQMLLRALYETMRTIMSSRTTAADGLPGVLALTRTSPAAGGLSSHRTTSPKCPLTTEAPYITCADTHTNSESSK